MKTAPRSMIPVAALLPIVGCLLVTTKATAQVNDACPAAILATVTNASTLTFAADTAAATSVPLDPALSCGIKSRNIWYQITAATAVSLNISTIGSTYDTVLAAFRGTCGAFTEIACNDDTPTGTESQLIVPLFAGETIFVQVSSDGGPGGPTLLTLTPAVPAQMRAKAHAGIIFSSDVSPLGGTYGRLQTAVGVGNRGVAFAAETQGIFVNSGAGPVAVALSGDPTPIGGTYAQFGAPSMNDSGTLVFHATIDGGPHQDAIFIDTGAGPGVLVQPGDPAPGGFAVYESFRDQVIVNRAGDIAFMGSTDFTAPGYELDVMDSAGVLTNITAEGAGHPCGGFIRRIGRTDTIGIDIQDDLGDVAFFVLGDLVDEAILTSAGGLAPVVCDGDPTPLGGTHSRIGRQPAIDNAGTVFFASDISGGPIASAVWSQPAIGPAVVEVSSGDVLLTGETIGAINSEVEVQASRAGLVGFSARVGPDVLIVQGSPTLGTYSAIAREGDACPTGGTLERIGGRLGTAANGALAFEADCTNGQGTFHWPVGGPLQTGGTLFDLTAIGVGFDFTGGSPTTVGSIAMKGARTGLYRTSCNGTSCNPAVTLLAPTSAIPSVPGQVLDSIDATTFNGQSKWRAFVGRMAGPAGNVEAIFGIDNGGALDKIAAVGDLLPGGVGTYLGFPTVPTIGDFAEPSAGTFGAAFFADVAGHPTADAGIFAAKPGTAIEIALTGSLSPTGGTFSSFGAPIVRKKSIVFRADTELDECIYVVARPGAPLHSIVCDGDPAPAAIGGTIDFIDSAVPTGTHKAVVFAAYAGAASTVECLLRWTRAAGVEVVRCGGDPYILGRTVDAFNTWDAMLSPTAEATGNGAVFSLETDMGTPDALVAMRKGRFYTLFDYLPGLFLAQPGDLVYAPRSRPSMVGKTVLAPVQLDGTGPRDAILRVLLY